MYVILQHSITSPAKFWEIVKGVTLSTNEYFEVNEKDAVGLPK